ncbi:hypothetical protein E6C67_14250 [Azospirillum sp. TSA2s]|uniref:hypothetical protein n=1 Tax=Azospirillum sp. TSA2s TaxID=709810 RepID=UPI0010A9F982|nr:hypothetical protein [Azospirillum sp. TSA2s]QCG94990.1 hypothetical protein E6C67_14250 [Azospirillum sp. TSA2s]
MTFPACLTIGGKPEAEKLQPRGNGWEFDGAASCRAYGPDMTPPTQFPPACLACVRRVRAELILAKEIQPHPRRGDEREVANG